MREKIPVTLKIENISKHKSRFDFEEVAEDLSKYTITDDEAVEFVKYLCEHIVNPNTWENYVAMFKSRSIDERPNEPKAKQIC